MNNNWNTKIKTSSDLEKDLLVKEVMKLRRQCEKMYDALKFARTELWDVAETPKKELSERLEKTMQVGNSLGVIIGHIDIEQKF